MPVSRIPCKSCDDSFPETLLIDGECNLCRIRNEEERQATIQQTKARAERIGDKDFDPKAVAQAELARRELARRHYLPFVERFNPQYLAGWFHKELATELEEFMHAVDRGESPRLMVFVPPRHGKSELGPKTYPAWVLGHHPEWEFITASYSGSLANRFSRNVRSIMRDPSYHALFDTRLDPDSQSVEQWNTVEGGGQLAVGVGGPATGNGAHIFLIDDPVKNREEAESPGIRQTAKDWYTSTAYTRLAPGGGVIIIQTRWHDDDLSGWLLTQMEEGLKQGGEDIDKWRVIEYPAIALKDEKHRKKGEALHEDRYPLTALNRIKKTVGDRDWWALYQQQPVADEGAYFEKKDFIPYSQNELDAIHDELRFYQAWDLAIGTKEHNDYTAGLTVGVDREENIWLVDLCHGKFAGDEIVEHIIDYHEKWRSELIVIERGQIDMAIGPFLDKRIEERKAYGLYYDSLPPGRRDKQARARPIQGMVRSGKVRVPMTHECGWIEGFIQELIRFPAAAHDDRVDAFAWVGQMLMELVPSMPDPEPKKASWRDKLHVYGVGGTDHKSFMSA